MGNCIGSPCAALRFSNKKESSDEDHRESEARAAVVREKSSVPCSGQETKLDSGLCRGPLPLSALLKSGQVQVQLHIADGCQRIKIVVNKEQLKLLTTSLEELKSRNVVIQSIRKGGKKWRPALATIPEF